MEQKQEPLVSICIPTFNGGKFIHRALESLIHQSYKNMEIIVADDASTDNTGEVVRYYASRDKRIVYFRNDTNLGGMKNLFKAIDVATGAYIQGLCHDDWLSRDCIGEGVQAFQLHPHIGMVLPQVISLDLKSNYIFSPRRFFINRGGRYSTNSFLKTGYKSQLALLCGSAIYRRRDLIDIKSFMMEVVESPDYAVACDFGFWGEALIPLKILSRYRYFVCNTNSAYVLIMHSKSYGGSRGADVSSHDISMRVKRSAVIRKFYEKIYTNELKIFLSCFRVGFGTQETADILLAFIKGKFPNHNFRKIIGGVFTILKHYSSSERFLIALSVLPVSFMRTLYHLERHLKEMFAGKGKYIRYYPKIFLDLNNGAAIFQFDSPGSDNSTNPLRQLERL